MTAAPAPAIRILANPTSGRGRGVANARRLQAQLAAIGQAADCTISRDAEHVEAFAREAAGSGSCEVLAVAGGDGTLRRAAQGLVGSDTALAVIPAGRGNDLVRALRWPADTREQARLIAARRTRAFDLGSCGTARFVTVATFGFDAEVSAIVHRREVPFRGTLSYVLATLKALSSFQPQLVRLEGDFGVIEGPVMMVSTANTATYGGGMRIAPDAATDDGLFDVCIVRPVGVGRLLLTLPRLFTGGHIKQAEVSIVRTRRLRIETAEPRAVFADGEPMALTPATLEVAPGVLRVVSP